MLLNVENLRKHFGPQEVFIRLNCRVEDNDRIGLVGPNGAGKSTLIKLLTGAEEPTEGVIEKKRGLRIGYLPQKPPALEGVTLWDAMLHAFDGIKQMEAQLHALAEDMADPVKHDEALKQYSDLQHEFESRGGYNYETRIKTVLSGLAFKEEQYEKPMSEFSGGQRTRAFLARLLCESPELLILDEPTNHLDLDSVEWLEQWLADFPHALLVVSHDRYFLDKVTARTWELHFGVLEAYRGNYSHYLRQREERFNERQSQWEAQQAYIERTQEFIRRFIAGQRSKEAQGRRTHLEKFMREEAIPRPRKPARVRIELDTKKISGDLVLQTKNLRVGYEAAKPIVEVEDIEVRRCERIALVGPNGAGKTTILRTLLGSLKALTGKVRLGAGVQIGYLSQAQDELNPAETVLSTIKALKEHFPDEGVRTILGAFLFKGDDVFKKVRDLSGGERSRLALARISVLGATVLMLDEPTNHLDIASQEELQEALLAFDGTIIFVSHDRYLVQALATKLWIVEHGKVVEKDGGWEAYLVWRSGNAASVAPAGESKRIEPEARAAEQDAAKTEAASKEQEEKRRAAQKEEQKRKRQVQKALERQQELEPRIAALEKQMADLTARISQAGEAQQRDEVMKLGQDYQQADENLKKLWDEWMQLGETAEQARQA